MTTSKPKRARPPADEAAPAAPKPRRQRKPKPAPEPAPELPEIGYLQPEVEIGPEVQSDTTSPRQELPEIGYLEDAPIEPVEIGGYSDHALQLAEEWIERAANDFGGIHRTKEAFYFDLYADGSWQTAFSFSDESRRYSRFVALVFTKAQQRVDPAVRFPSQTETNNWFWHFRRREQLRSANVPEHLLPTSRAVSNALASAVASVPSPEEKVQVQKAILMKLADESDRNAKRNGAGLLPPTAASIKEIAGSMGYRKPRPARPTNTRQLEDVDQASWSEIVRLVNNAYQTLRSQLPADKERIELMKLTARLHDLVLAPSPTVFGVFNVDERFEGMVVEVVREFKAYPRVDGIQKNPGDDGWIAKPATRIEGESVVCCEVTDGDEPDEGGLEAVIGKKIEDQCQLRLLTVSDEREAAKRAEELTRSLGRIVAPIALAVYRGWREGEHGRIPIGTPMDEVIEPD